MEHEQPVRPKWADQYLRLEAWTMEELRNLLCGLPPVQPLDAPARTRQEISDEFVRAEAQRVVADRHVRDAVVTGQLPTMQPLDESIVATAEKHMSVTEVAAIKRALIHERACQKTYIVESTQAIRWASRRSDLFPDFPFDDSDLPGGGEAMDVLATDSLRQHRRGLVTQALDELGYMTKGALCKSLRISDDALRAVVNGDRARYGEETQRRVLKALRLTQAEWNKEP